MKLGLFLLPFNNPDFIRDLYASLETQTLKEWTLHVLDNSTNEEAAKEIEKITRAQNFSYTYEKSAENSGFSGGHNHMYAQFGKDYDALQLLNHDTVLELDYLERLVNALQNDETLGAAEGVVLRLGSDNQKTDVVDSIGLHRTWYGATYDMGSGMTASDLHAHNEAVWGVSGCLPMYRVAAIAASSLDDVLFANYFMYKEDVELAYRLHRKGWKAMIIREAIGYHRRSIQYLPIATRFTGKLSFADRYSYRNHLTNLLVHEISLLSPRFWLGILPYETAKVMFYLIKKPTLLFITLKELWAKRHEITTKRRSYKKLFA